MNSKHLLVCMVLVSNVLAAQSSLRDSVAAPAREPDSKVGFMFNTDFRNSFIYQKPVNVWGMNAGLTFGTKQHQLLVGYYWLTYNSTLKFIDLSKNAAQLLNLDFYTKTDLYFFNLIYLHRIVSNDKWLVSVPLEMGIGRAADYDLSILTDDNLNRTKNRVFYPAQLGLIARYKLMRWMGLTLQTGYRYSVYSPLKQNFNGMYYSVGIALLPDMPKDILGSIRRRNKKKTQH